MEKEENIKNIIQMENVVYSYDKNEKNIISNLSFTITKPGIYSIIGVSGCGKSTIFRLLNGLSKANSGDIFINEKNILHNQKDNILCGYMPQKDTLFPWRTILDNICLPMEISKSHSKEEMRKKAIEALEAVGLKDYQNKMPNELSGGMRQRVAFARTMLTGSDIWLLDEPFSALDFLTKISMQEWLLNMLERDNKTVLFITHDVEEAIFLSKKVLVVESTPIQELQEFIVPEEYPRTRACLKNKEMIDLKEELIDVLRKQVEI